MSGTTDVYQQVSFGLSKVLDSLELKEWRDDDNLKDTPRRVAEMYINEALRGLREPMPELTDFPNTGKLDQLYTVGPVPVRSMCAHHLLPVIGEAWIGVFPHERVLGLSKFARVTEWVFARPTLQESATQHLGDVLQIALEPLGLAVAVRAQHTCMTWRGVKADASTCTTMDVRGELRQDKSLKAEFLTMIGGQGF